METDILLESYVCQTATSISDRMRLSLYSKLNWWLDHFADCPFPQWREHNWCARRISTLELADIAVSRGAVGFMCERTLVVSRLSGLIEGWARGFNPDAVELHAVCRLWDVPVDGWIFNPDVLATEVP